MKNPIYTRNVFINCPFDPAYNQLLNALVFTIFACGYTPRCAKESGDGGEIRINEIKKPEMGYNAFVTVAAEWLERYLR
jgi:hypothetical protein